MRLCRCLWTERAYFWATLSAAEMRFAAVCALLTLTTSFSVASGTLRLGACPQNLEAVDSLDSAQARQSVELLLQALFVNVVLFHSQV